MEVKFDLSYNSYQMSVMDYCLVTVRAHILKHT